MQHAHSFPHQWFKINEPSTEQFASAILLLMPVHATALLLPMLLHFLAMLLLVGRHYPSPPRKIDCLVHING